MKPVTVGQSAGRALMALLQNGPEKALEELRRQRLVFIDGEPVLVEPEDNPVPD